MGTWGAGSFENDTALDWISALVSADDIAAALAGVEADPERVLDAVDAERLIAAADCVAAMKGQPSPDMPPQQRERVSAFGRPSEAMVRAARMAVMRVLRNSELTELWLEAGAGPFNRSMTSLIARLSSVAASLRQGKGDGKASRSSKRRLVLQTCSFCGEEIQREELFSFELADMSNEVSAATKRGAWCHLACLNERLHPKHLVQNWKFSKEELEAELKRSL